MMENETQLTADQIAEKEREAYQEHFLKYFANASRIPALLPVKGTGKPRGLMTEDEWKAYENHLISLQEELDEKRGVDGLRIFKRRVLGLCGRESYKTLEELADICLFLHICPNGEEAIKFADSLIGKEIDYGSDSDSNRVYLSFVNVRDYERKRNAIRITEKVQLPPSDGPL